MPTASYSPPRVIVDLESAGEMLRAAGHRLSASRRGVIVALLRADGPVSAEYIAGGLGGRTERLDLPSTYRNLDLLERLGAVHHVHVGHGPGLYALRGRGPRAYVVCEACGRLARLNASDVESIREGVREATGFEAHFSHFPVVGLCPGCAGTDHPHGGAMSHDHEDDHEHEGETHAHEHSHGDVTHSHAHDTHDHDHVEHEHEHAHGDRIHSHPHVHQEGLEDEHSHEHDD